MIIDQFGVFFDNKASAASMTSDVVNFMSYAGREDPIYISLLAKGPNTAAVTYTVHVQQSENGSTFATAGTFTVAKPDAQAVLQAIRLPIAVKGPYVRLSVTVSGAVTGGTLFAAVTRDHFAPYGEGLYINAGQVVA